MPEVRPPSLGDKLGTAVARTSGGVSQGAGQAVELARLRSNSGQQLSQFRVGGVYTADDTHGPGGDASHEFTFPIGGTRWVAQVDASADVDVADGSFFIGVTGVSPGTSGIGPVPLFSGNAAATVTVLVDGSVNDGELLVTVSIDAPGFTSAEFTVHVTAFPL